MYSTLCALGLIQTTFRGHSNICESQVRVSPSTLPRGREGILPSVPSSQPTTELRDQRHLVGGLRSLGGGGPWKGPETPWAHAPALTQACLAGQEAGSDPEPGAWLPPTPALPWGCFQGQIQRRGQPAFSPMPVGSSCPDQSGGGGNNTVGGSSPRASSLALLRPLPVWPPRAPPCAHVPFHPAVRLEALSLLGGHPHGGGPHPGAHSALPTNSATAGAGLHHMNLAGRGGGMKSRAQGWRPHACSPPAPASFSSISQDSASTQPELLQKRLL